MGALLTRGLVKSERSVAVNRLAQLGQERFPGIELSWLGQGSWKKLLDHLQVSKLQIVFETPAGDTLDPSQHFVFR